MSNIIGKIIDIPNYRHIQENDWSKCRHCGFQVLTDYCKREFYHAINCPKSNGIDYRRRIEMICKKCGGETIVRFGTRHCSHCGPQEGTR